MHRGYRAAAESAVQQPGRFDRRRAATAPAATTKKPKAQAALMAPRSRVGPSTADRPTFGLIRSGGAGIRTLGGVTPSHAFEACSLGRSDTPPPSRVPDALRPRRRGMAESGYRAWQDHRHEHAYRRQAG